VDSRQGQGIVEEDSKGSRGSQWAIELMMKQDINITESSKWTTLQE
jgi:hypothetical protein